MSKPQIVVKVVVLGDPQVGKTALVDRFSTGSFENDYKLTLGVNITIRRLTIGETEIAFQIHDIAGHAFFSEVRPNFYIGSGGAILVYDVTRPETLPSLIEWKDEFYKNCSQESPVVILGNKTDLIEDRSKLIIGEEFAQKEGTTHFGTSAKDGSNVQTAFETIARKIINEDLGEIKR
jgi:small GTP-binding protein